MQSGVPYAGGNVGILVDDTTADSQYGSVDSNCIQNGTVYTANY